ncbi:hypothetical protein [Dongia sp.]|uniref:hypothetical protein n=1 Tax=Dongia sp. TaxID=1977262 RepID=UPI0035B09F2F
MSSLRSAASVIGTAIKSAVKAIGYAVKKIGKASVGAVRLAGRSALATARVGYRTASVATRIAANMAHSLIDLFGRGSPELPEAPESQVFSPTEEWLAEMEESHLDHELGEVDKLVDDDPRAIVYSYMVAPDDAARRKIDLSLLPDDVRSWACRMIEPERLLVRRAGCERMLAHLDGTKMIKGVRKLTPRKAVIDFTQRKSSDSYSMADDFGGPGTEMRLAL